MDMSKSVMGPSSAETERRSMASEIPGYSGPKEAETATVQRMRVGTAGGNLMGRRTGNLMSKPAATGNLMAKAEP